MTSIQWFALVILPAAIAAFGVVVGLRARREAAQHHGKHLPAGE
ncbi:MULTISPECIES: hypothetical protein [unclassified Xanthobacter]|nr:MULTISPECIES: hypothetical protein [unclassified Xanthobacter]